MLWTNPWRVIGIALGVALLPALAFWLVGSDARLDNSRACEVAWGWTWNQPWPAHGFRTVVARAPITGPLAAPGPAAGLDREAAAALRTLAAQARTLERRRQAPRPDCGAIKADLPGGIDPGPDSRTAQARRIGQADLVWYSQPVASGGYALITEGRMTCRAGPGGRLVSESRYATLLLRRQALMRGPSWHRLAVFPGPAAADRPERCPTPYPGYIRR